MNDEIYVILRSKQRRYDHQAVAASRNVHWAEQILARLPEDIRDEFHIRPVQVAGAEGALVVYYDRWAHGAPLSLSGFGVDRSKLPSLPMEPEERFAKDLSLDVEPENIPLRAKRFFERTTHIASLIKPRSTVKQPLFTRREGISLLVALAVWLLLLALFLTATHQVPVYLKTEATLPKGMAFPLAYESPVSVDHAGWIYVECGLSSSAFKRLHGNLPWLVIAQDESMNVISPEVFAASSHERGGFSFASGLGDVEQWRRDHFHVIRTGCFITWADGSKLVYDMGSDRLYGQVSHELALDLYGR